MDENTTVPCGVEIGYSAALDGERYQITEGGVVLVARGMLEGQNGVGNIVSG